MSTAADAWAGPDAVAADHTPMPELLRRGGKTQNPAPAQETDHAGGAVSPDLFAEAVPPRLPAVPSYEILGELGRGNMGVVYRARQLSLHRIVALKMIRSGAHAGEADPQRFLTEACVVGRLQHPNIIQVHEVGQY